MLHIGKTRNRRQCEKNGTKLWEKFETRVYPVTRTVFCVINPKTRGGSVIGRKKGRKGDRSRRHRLGVKPLKLHGEVGARLCHVLHYLPISSPLTNSTKVSQITSYHLALTWPVRRRLLQVIIVPCDRSLSVYSDGFTYSITSTFQV